MRASKYKNQESGSALNILCQAQKPEDRGGKLAIITLYSRVENHTELYIKMKRDDSSQSKCINI